MAAHLVPVPNPDDEPIDGEVWDWGEMPTDFQIQFVHQAALVGTPVRLMASALGVKTRQFNEWVRLGQDPQAPEPLMAFVEALRKGEAERAMALLSIVHNGATQDPKLALALLERTVPEFHRKTAVQAEIKPTTRREELIQKLQDVRGLGAGDE